MIQKTSYYITDVIRFISEFDTSIFYNPLKFQGYIRDYYIGNRLVADDFIKVLSFLSNKIEKSVINTQDISNIRLEGISGSEKNKIHSELFKAIYINNDIRRIRNIESYIASIYGELAEYNKPIETNTSNSPIISFSGGGEHIVEYGQLVSFVWECEKPHRLCLTNGHESMDVTHIDSIVLSVMFDCYELILYNEEGKIVDKRIINMQYKKNVYCINCGNIYFDAAADNYCIKCGVRIFHGN
jgi:hypothetical protein